MLKTVITAVAVILVIVGIYFSFSTILDAAAFVVRIFLPFILGYVFFIAVKPLAVWFRKKLKLPVPICAVLAMVLTLGVAGGLATFGIVKLVGEIRNLYTHLPSIFANIQRSFQTFNEKWSLIYSGMPENVQEIFTNVYSDFMRNMYKFIDNKSSPIMDYAGEFAKSLPNIFISFIVFILSSFFMLSDMSRVSNWVKKHFGRLAKIDGGKLEIVEESIKKYLGGYIKAQLTIMSIAFVVIFAGLSILKVDYALLIALAVAVFDALPFFGSGAVFWPWAVISFFNSQISLGVGLIIIYFVVIFTRQMIEPKIVSNNIGTHPIATLAAMYVGYKVFSIGGMILGPLVMMLCISLKRAGLFDGIINFFELIRKIIVNILNEIKKSYASFGRSVEERYDEAENNKTEENKQ